MWASIHQQLHGYRSGHQLLQSSVRLDPKDQDQIDHLSDMAGPLRPGEKFDAYLSAYPLPSLKYYALARTEQDLDTRRPGCVTTKTFLIPMHFWENEANPGGLGELLKGPTSGEPVLVSTGLQASTLAPVSHPALAELVEALFLETRSAIVVFEAPIQDEVALRLLTALWPAMRREFSLCTFALAPRILSGKLFDLLFAPKSARARFATWNGRRVEAAGKEAGERHRWTSTITQRIFHSRIPHLLNPDIITALAADDDAESESILRLCLLWEELSAKAIDSPTAVLGLIDIAASRNALASSWGVLEPAIANAVTDAAESMDTKGAWNFLATLFGKLGNEPLIGITREALLSAGTKLTRRNWRSALTFLAAEAPIARGNSGELMQSLTASLAAVNANQLARALIAVPPNQLLRVSLLDDGFTARIFATTDPGSYAVLIQRLTQGLKSSPSEERGAYGRHFLPCIRSDQDSALLAQIIEDAETSQLVEAVDMIWGSNARRSPQLGEVLCDAAAATGNRFEVRTAFARLGDDDQTNRCIERLLVADPVDMGWLLEHAEIGNRRTKFLNDFVEGLDLDDLTQAFSSARVATEALHLLAKNLGQCAPAAARIVALPTIHATEHITLGLKIYPMLRGPERAMLVQSIVSRVLTDAAVKGSDLPERVMATVLDDIDVADLVAIGLAIDLDGEQVSRTLVAFDRAAPAVRASLEAHVDLIVQLIARRRDFDLTVDGAMAIATLIETAPQMGRQTYVKICSTILPFAMAGGQKPASPIIIAAFPTIYDRMRRNSDNVGLRKLFIFVDWDKCKIARKHLVRTFMKSKWPPIDLAITALRACELNKILKQLTKEPGGRIYLAKIEKDAQELQEMIRKPVLRAIKKLRDPSTLIPGSNT